MTENFMEWKAEDFHKLTEEKLALKKAADDELINEVLESLLGSMYAAANEGETIYHVPEAQVKLFSEVDVEVMAKLKEKGFAILPLKSAGHNNLGHVTFAMERDGFIISWDPAHMNKPQLRSGCFNS